MAGTGSAGQRRALRSQHGRCTEHGAGGWVLGAAEHRTLVARGRWRGIWRGAGADREKSLELGKCRIDSGVRGQSRHLGEDGESVLVAA